MLLLLLVPLAHKHAHHLHTIPPRQKSTRTLILDHMLWLHARTRFSQVRAELGLADLDTDEDAFWLNPGNGNGPFVQLSRRDALMASLRYGPARSFMEEVGVEEMSRADHVQARALRQKADGLEKVLTAIMDQCFEPPPSQCPRPRSMHLDLLTSSPSSRDRSSNVHSGLSVLPNGVRVRLAVGALINILFSRVDDPLSLPSTTSVTRANSSINVSSLPASLIPLCLDATESADPSAQAQFVANGPTSTTLAIFNLNDTFFQPLDVAGIFVIIILVPFSDHLFLQPGLIMPLNHQQTAQAPQNLLPHPELPVEAKIFTPVERRLPHRYLFFQSLSTTQCDRR
jgi:hypothetical protein